MKISIMLHYGSLPGMVIDRKIRFRSMRMKTSDVCTGIYEIPVQNFMVHKLDNNYLPLTSHHSVEVR